MCRKYAWLCERKPANHEATTASIVENMRLKDRHPATDVLI